MALSGSGSISFSQIQTERGGSNPISLNEYYGNGSFVFANTSSVVVSPTINGASVNTTVTTGLPGKTVTHTVVNNNFGFKHSSLAASNRPTVGQAGITTPSVRSGVDNSGNAGTIPNSGSAISMDHFRGTSVGTAQTFVIWGVEYHTSSTATLGTSTNHWYFYFQGHLGTNNQGDVSWDGMPFSTIVSIATGSPAAPATTFTFAGSHTTNGAVGPKGVKTHLSNSTIGNYTECKFLAASTSYRHSTSNSTWQLTCNV